MASKITQAKLSIGGMTCMQCQKKIENRLRSTKGILKVSVSYSKGTADILYDTGKSSLKDIKQIIEKMDYRILPDGQKPTADFGHVTLTLAIIVVFYFILQYFGILNLLVPSQLADSNMGYGMLFVIGLATSIHCITMCGGINLSQSLPRSAESSVSTGEAFLPSVLYNLGRVASYTVIGFLLGGVGFLIGGGQVGLSALLQGILKLIAGTFMVIMGINMLGLFPWLRHITPRVPKFLAKKLGTQRAKAAGPLAVGILNGLMPCGPLQSMQIVALASGSPLTGALSMFLFSLGTVPLMLGLGSLVSVLGKQFAKTVNYAGSILVAVLGLAMLSQGASLSDLLQTNTLLVLILTLFALGIMASLPLQQKVFRFAGMAVVVCTAAVILTFQSRPGSPVSDNNLDSVSIDQDVQVVTSTLSPGRYPSITVQAGIPVKWVINAPEGSINGCNYKMLLQKYGIAYTFQEGENSIEFTPSDVGTFQYTCWMGMIRGHILVTDGSTDESSENVVYSAETYTVPNGLPSCCQ